MNPLELLGLICLFAVVRVAISIRPEVAVPAGSGPTARTVIREYLDAFIVAGLVAFFLTSFIIRTFFIPSASMEPTLQIHDVLLVNEFEYRISKPHDGDIVVFVPPIPSPEKFIKRIMGQPGDSLRVHDGTVYRNGQPLREPYIAAKPNYEMEIKDYGITVNGFRLDSSSANIPPREKWTAPDRIPDGYYFMMGDNRINSEDSHAWGFAQPSGTFTTGQLAGQKAEFTGHAFVVFWPLPRLGILH